MPRLLVKRKARVLSVAVLAVVLLCGMVCWPVPADPTAAGQKAAQLIGVCVYTFGDNVYGQLGVGDLLPHSGVQVRYYGHLGASVVGISTQGTHTLILLKDPMLVWTVVNSLIGFGDNHEGELGLSPGPTFPVWYPATKVPSPTVIAPFSTEQVLAISAGFYHTLVLSRTASGVTKLYSFGRNAAGQLGIGTTDGHGMRQEVTFFSGMNVRAISAGGESSLVLVEDVYGNSHLYGFGWNLLGQLGLGNTTPYYTYPQPISGIPSGPHSISAISTSGMHSLVLMANGDVYSFGMNSNGQLGLGYTSAPVTTPTKIPMSGPIKGISAGWRHSLFIYQGGVASCGLNSSGQLGFGDKVDRWSPTLIPGTAPYTTAISAGWIHSLYLNGLTHTAYGCGSNASYQLGLTATTVYLSPQVIPVGAVRAIAAGWVHSLLVGM